MRFVAVLLVLAAAGCSSPIQHGLDEPAANEVMTALERAGIGAQKERDEGATNENVFVVRVSQSEAVRALEVLHAQGLPRGRRSGFAEVYKHPSLVPTATEERARYIEALAGEIERTLETVDGVVEARVHLVLSETDPLSPDGKPRVPAQAAVLLKARRGVAPIQESDVQKLVAGSVPGLHAGAVSVVVTASADRAGEGAPALMTVGPFRVAPGSRTLLVSALAGAIVIVTALAALLLLLARRLADVQRR